jgi:hypothetical protein
MRKVSSKLAICITATLLVFGVSTCVVAQPRTQIEPKINWEVPTKDFIGKRALMTYQAVAVEPINLEHAQEMAGQLRETAETRIPFDNVQEYDGRFIFTSSKDSSAVFDIDSATGTFLFNAGMKGYSGEGSTRGLPSPREAPDLAREYLTKLRYLPDNKGEVVLTRVGGLGMAAAKDGRSSDKYEKLVTVFFHRVLQDVRVQGPGSRILVHLGEQGNLVGLIRNWPEVKAQKVSENQVKSDELIRDAIQRRLLKMAGEAKEITVQKAELVLFDDGRGIIEPAIYVVAGARYQGPKRANGVVEVPVDFYVPVLLNPKGYYPFHKDAEANWPGSDSEQ